MTPLLQKRQQSDYLMQLAIAHNPYSDSPEALWNELKPKPEYLTAGLDRAGMEALKAQFNRTG